MGRRQREDFSGCWHHVMNRAVNRRTMFEQSFDTGRFLERLELAVEQCGVEVHAYAVMQTHFHLLLRSREGRLSEAMHLIQSPFVRRFNRSRRRDGPLMRGRFRSEPVHSIYYRRYVVRYIDSNPVAAGLVSDPKEYSSGSARHYARTSGPLWLSRDWIESEVRRVARSEKYRPADYAIAFPPTVTDEQREFTNSRPDGARWLAESFDELLSYTIRDWERWMRERAELADGQSQWVPLVSAERVQRWVANAGLSEDRAVRRRDSKVSERNLVLVLLLRRAAAAAMQEIAAAVGCSRPTVAMLIQLGERRVREDAGFSARVAQGMWEVFGGCWRGAGADNVYNACLAPVVNV